MPFRSGELKYLYELLIEVGHPISASEAARLFARGELEQYVRDVIDRLLPPACTPGDTKCEGFDLYRCEEVLGSPQWVRIEENSAECGYMPPPTDPEIKEKGIKLYQARLDAWSVWMRAIVDFENAEAYLSDVGDEWLYAQYQWDKYRGFLYEWTEAEDNYWRNKREIEGLQDDIEDLERQLSDLYGQISAWHNEMFDIQDEIDWYEYIVEMYQEDVAYWQDKYDQLGLDWYDCMVVNQWYGPACQHIYDEQMEAQELLDLAEEHLEDALDNLTYFLQLKWLLMRQVDDAWDDVADVQYWIATLENEIEDLLGVLADIDTIKEQIDRFEAFVDYWNSEKWRLEDEMEVARIRVRVAQNFIYFAEGEFDEANRAWSRFIRDHPVIAQEILDEW